MSLAQQQSEGTALPLVFHVSLCPRGIEQPYSIKLWTCCNFFSKLKASEPYQPIVGSNTEAQYGKEPGPWREGGGGYGLERNMTGVPIFKELPQPV